MPVVNLCKLILCAFNISTNNTDTQDIALWCCHHDTVVARDQSVHLMNVEQRQLHVVSVVYYSPHPYLFFNDDGNSFTFMGFIINPQTGDILDPRTLTILTPQVLPQQLQQALLRNRVNLSENFDQLQRHVQLLVLIAQT